MTIARELQDKIQDTKDNSIYIECDIIGDGSENNSFRPEVFDKYNAYWHTKKSDFDYNAMRVKVYVNKKRTKTTELQKIRNDSTLNKIKETTGGSVISIPQ